MKRWLLYMCAAMVAGHAAARVKIPRFLVATKSCSVKLGGETVPALVYLTQTYHSKVTRNDRIVMDIDIVPATDNPDADSISFSVRVDHHATDDSKVEIYRANGSQSIGNGTISEGMELNFDLPHSSRDGRADSVSMSIQAVNDSAGDPAFKIKFNLHGTMDVSFEDTLQVDLDKSVLDEEIVVPIPKSDDKEAR